MEEERPPGSAMPLLAHEEWLLPLPPVGRAPANRAAVAGLGAMGSKPACEANAAECGWCANGCEGCSAEPFAECNDGGGGICEGACLRLRRWCGN